MNDFLTGSAGVESKLTQFPATTSTRYTHGEIAEENTCRSIALCCDISISHVAILLNRRGVLNLDELILALEQTAAFRRMRSMRLVSIWSRQMFVESYALLRQNWELDV